MSILTQFLRHPLSTGAIAASSHRLAAAMTDGMELERARTVVELGPGTGAFTGAILDRLAPGVRLLAIEINPVLADRVAERYAGRPLDVVHGSAADLAALATAPVDAVLSGLPWTVMPGTSRHRILDAVADVLAPTGRFATFAYGHAAWTPSARHFHRELADRFRGVLSAAEPTPRPSGRTAPAPSTNAIARR
jgi:phosphatidylethanolamine/phosphatidyl-N-methylethanolamine N-methyltransferase